MKAKDLRQQSQAELTQTLSRLCREQFKLRLQAGNEMSKTHPIRAIRRDIARVETVLREQRG